MLWFFAGLLQKFELALIDWLGANPSGPVDCIDNIVRCSVRCLPLLIVWLCRLLNSNRLVNSLPSQIGALTTLVQLYELEFAIRWRQIHLSPTGTWVRTRSMGRFRRNFSACRL